VNTAQAETFNELAKSHIGLTLTRYTHLGMPIAQSGSKKFALTPKRAEKAKNPGHLEVVKVNGRINTHTSKKGK
jgi:hypothetical protein